MKLDAESNWIVTGLLNIDAAQARAESTIQNVTTDDRAIPHDMIFNETELDFRGKIGEGGEKGKKGVFVASRTGGRYLSPAKGKRESSC